MKYDALAEANVASINIEQTEGSDNDSCNEKISKISSIYYSIVSTETVENIKLRSDLLEEMQISARETFQKFTDVFTDLPGKTDLIECDIKVTSTEPVKQYPMPHNMTEEVKKEEMKMIGMDVIERSESPYSFPIVIAKKTDGTNSFVLILKH